MPGGRVRAAFSSMRRFTSPELKPDAGNPMMLEEG